MGNKLKFDDMLGEQGYHLEDEEYLEDYLTNDDLDFTNAFEINYLLFDNRTWKSNIEDIKGGDNFADYCEEFFELLDEEEYFEN